MPTSFRGLSAATLAAASLISVSPALAQSDDDAASPIAVTGSVGVVTDYRFRGVSLSGGDPAVQGGFTLTHDSGFYAGTWGSSIDDGGSDIYGDVELDLFGGWSGSIAEGIGLDVGLLYYAYPTNAGGVDAEYFEPYASVSGSLGPVSAKVGVNYAWSQDSIGDEDNLYLHTELSAGIPNTPFTLNGHLGYTNGVLAPPFLAGAADDSGLDWSIGASATMLGRFTVGLAYTGVEGPSVDNFTDDAVVGSVTVSF